LVRNTSALAVYPFPESSAYVFFASVSRDEVELMFQRIDGYQDRISYLLRAAAFGDAYIRMKGLRVFTKQSQARSKYRCLCRQQVYGDWEFEVRDPNGYYLFSSANFSNGRNSQVSNSCLISGMLMVAGLYFSRGKKVGLSLASVTERYQVAEGRWQLGPGSCDARLTLAEKGQPLPRE